MKNFIIVIIFFPFLLFSQINLVPNSSFELSDNYPQGGLGIIGLQFAPYNTDVFGWFNPNTLSPDYYSAVNYPPLQQFTLPNNMGYVGIATYGVNQPVEYVNGREYISCQLDDTLVENDFYFVSFYTRVFRIWSRFASNNLGVHFSDTALHANNCYNFDLDSQIKYFDNEIIEDTAHWTLVSGLYQAHGGEKFITLGNFNTDAETTQGMEYSDGQNWQTYFLIDEVSVIPLDSIPGSINVDAGPDQSNYIGKTAFIGQKISNLPANWFELDGTPVAQNTSGVYVSPLETTTYVVEMNLNGQYSTDTVTVFVDGLGMEEHPLGEWSLAPNPNKGNFSVQLKTTFTEPLELFITDSQGRKVWQEVVPAFSKVYTLQTNLSAGVYFLQLSSKGQKSELKRVVVE